MHHVLITGVTPGYCQNPKSMHLKHIYFIVCYLTSKLIKKKKKRILRNKVENGFGENSFFSKKPGGKTLVRSQVE